MAGTRLHGERLATGQGQTRTIDIEVSLSARTFTGGEFIKN